MIIYFHHLQLVTNKFDNMRRGKEYFSENNCEYYIHHVDNIKQRYNKKIKYADILLKAL